jgi:hypothetical protein
MGSRWHDEFEITLAFRSATLETNRGFRSAKACFFARALARLKGLNSATS